jgi:hypothetical protein
MRRKYAAANYWKKNELMDRMEQIPIRVAIRALRNRVDPIQVAEFLEAVLEVAEEDAASIIGEMLRPGGHP